MTSLRVVGGTTQVRIVDGVIVAVDNDRSGEPAVDATGCVVMPGFVDLQLNGAYGIDFTLEPERVAEVAALLPRSGVTSFLPTVITSSPDRIVRAVAAIQPDGGEHRAAARSLGIHIEGPFLSPQRIGAHPPKHIRPPSLIEVDTWLAAGSVTLVTLAPELPGALEVIERLVAGGVVVNAGHTAATPAQLDSAVAAGVTGATHLFNAMGPLNARLPGPAGAVLAAESIIAGIIVDGLHVDPVMVAVAWKVLGVGRLALVTDAMAALGLGDGVFRVGDTEVVVDATGARTRAGVLAGSMLGMDQAVRNLMAFAGCTVVEAAACASATPARLLGRADLGTLEPGARGDVVVLDENGFVEATVVGGVIAFDPHGRAQT